MTLTRLWAFLAIGLPVLAATIASLPTVDLAYHLRAGAITLDTGAIPRVDTFTFTAAGQPWQNQQWGAQVLLDVAYRLAGWTGLVLLRAALVGCAFGLLFDACRRRSGSVRIAAWLALAAFACAAVTLGLRPQLFAVALFSAVLWVVVQRRERPGLTWLAVPLILLWTNVHGSFFLGPLLVGIGLVEDLVDRDPAWRRSAALLVGALVATVVNPFGLTVWSYVAGISTNELITSRVTEWQPTTVRTPEGVLFYGSAGLVAIAFVVAARRGRVVRPTTLLWLVPFLAIGAYAVRGLAWWPLVAAVVVAGLAAVPADASSSSRPVRPAPEGTPMMRRTNLVLTAILVLAAVAALPAWRPIDPGLRAPAGVVGTAPPGITGALRGLVRPGDRLLAPQPWGSWFEFALPDTLVAIDSRIELFPIEVWNNLDRIETGATGWEAALAGWGVSIVVASPDQRDFVTRLQAAGWRDAFHDEDGTVLVLAR
ncbi:MAG TPA: hypothetical protein VFY18_04300 [Candidatus Limnocylindrales bacterium]|nr:hypothetical protein [Candidatus Limnocylindrales bacterium]